MRLPAPPGDEMSKITADTSGWMTDAHIYSVYMQIEMVPTSIVFLAIMNDLHG
jgi:hypothetical protein